MTIGEVSASVPMNAFKNDFHYWLLAVRPKTLVASASPVILASALAFYEGVFQMVPAVLCLLFGVLCQIGANWLNDLADYRKGADHAGRIGPARMVSSGKIAPQAMQRGIVGVFLVAFLVGCGLLPYGGLGLIIVGLASILAAFLYSAGPFPFAYLGLGDALDFIFFGFIATIMTYYVQALTIKPAVIWLGFGIGCMINNILLINNMRDMESDALVGKKTIIVRFGRRFGIIMYRLSWLCALAVPVLLWNRYGYSVWTLLPVVLYVKLLYIQKCLLRASKPEDWRVIFEGTAKSVLLYTLLLTIGLLIGKSGNFFGFSACL